MNSLGPNFWGACLWWKVVQFPTDTRISRLFPDFFGYWTKKGGLSKIVTKTKRRESKHIQISKTKFEIFTKRAELGLLFILKIIFAFVILTNFFKKSDSQQKFFYNFSHPRI